MAILGATSLTGCDSIPSFIATSSRMVFEQTAAPTSWTKETNAAYNDVALRVVTGTVSSGGATPFVTVFPNSPRSTPVALSGPSGLSVQGSGTILGVQGSPIGSGVGVQGHTLTTAQIRSHTHGYTVRGTTLGGRGSASLQNTPLQPFEAITSGAAGGDVGHGHGISDSNHGHPISPGNHTHPTTEASHSHTFTMTARDFRLLYMDVIICSKN
jgi:hypothetical protein